MGGALLSMGGITEWLHGYGNHNRQLAGWVGGALLSMGGVAD